MQIVNGNVLDGNDNRFKKLNITVNDGRIASLDKNISDADTFDATDLYVIPGFIDTHIHGCVGVEFASPDEDFAKGRQWLASEGVTAFAATVRSMPMDRMIAAEKNIIRESAKPVTHSRIMGINFEGPFISYNKSGVMTTPEGLECNSENISTLINNGEGLLKLITLAPERENAIDTIKTAVSLGVNISIGHTDATYEQTISAVNAGACRATHVFNAMRPLSHRETGVLGAVLTDDRINCEMICDFVHLDAPAVRLVYRAKGYKNVTLISDTGAMSGLGDGEYVIDGKVRIVKEGVCRNPSGRIAGSCFSMHYGAKNLLSLGIPLEEISVMASLNPAKALKCENDLGSIEIGKYADLIVCDKELNIKAVFINGEKV